MEEKNEKIVFAIKPNIEKESHYMVSFVGLSSYLKEGLIKFGYASNEFNTLCDDVKKLVDEGKEGKFIVNDCIVFILPESFTRLHTQQYPLIILKDMDQVIDIDEWWYTPFKNLMFNTPKYEHTTDNKTWERGRSLEGALEDGYIIRFKTNDEDSDWLYGIKTRNVTFNLD